MSKTLHNVITVDPGWNTGIAYWLGDNKPITKIIKEPPRRKIIKVEPSRLKYMFAQFSAIINSFIDTPDDCYIEGVEMWSGNVRSLTSAQRGNLFSLAYLVGGYIEICHRKNIIVRLVYPRGNKAKGQVMWKGQLNTKKLTKRIQRINGLTYPEHIREAVGIGFSVMGVL
jgi:hypothetical protein